MNQPNNLLRTYRVNYVSGLPQISKIVRKISMHLYESGFFLHGYQFPNLWIPYNAVINFKLSTGYGSILNYAGAGDALNEKIININYFANQQKVFIKFEMAISTFSPMINYRACKELIGFMQSNGIFNKFIPATKPNSSSDIMAQIERLSALHKSGALTDAEFEAKKTELLNRI